MSNKDKIIKLRKEGKSYLEISKILNISKATISYHCKRIGINHLSIRNNNDKIKKIKDLCKKHTIKEVSDIMNVSISTVKRYKNKKSPLTEIEKKQSKVKHTISWRKRTKEKLVEYKGGKCVRCGYNKCIRSLDFHHINPEEKDFGISKSIKSFEKMKSEVDKCILVCKNCHGEIHDEIENIKLSKMKK